MNNLFRLIGRRLIALPLMILGVTILVFILTALNPVDQASAVLGDSAGEQQLAEYRHEHGLDQPIVIQYFLYLGNLIHGDLGTFGGNNASVAEKISEALPVTLQLTFCGLLIGVIFAVFLGVISALYRDKWQDQTIRVVSIAAIATPSF